MIRLVLFNIVHHRINVNSMLEKIYPRLDFDEQRQDETRAMVVGTGGGGSLGVAALYITRVCGQDSRNG